MIEASASLIVRAAYHVGTEALRRRTSAPIPHTILLNACANEKIDTPIDFTSFCIDLAVTICARFDVIMVPDPNKAIAQRSKHQHSRIRTIRFRLRFDPRR